MANQRNRQRKAPESATVLEQARDELFQHIMRCGVIGSAPEHQGEWFNDTMAYLADRYHELSTEEIAELRTLGERFCQPPKLQEETADTASAA
jgi:hypothetical protein